VSNHVATKRLLTLVVAILCAIAPLGRAATSLIVHEWGTFTSLQDENGRGIGGINSDDEPVPDFVHNIASGLLLPASAQSKSVARCHPGVTMRLETPVIYFYPPENFHSHFDVRVAFNGGWITQYFPNATVEAPGIDQDGFGPLEPWTHGNLEWKNIFFTDSEELPATNARVWTAPRLDNAATVETNGEHEKFLFYRGVGHKDAPIRLVRSGPEFTITKETNDIADLWLVDIRPDGTTAFRVLHPFNQAPAFVLKTPSTFKPEEYSTSATSELRSALHKALVTAGLFDNEADALLETWQISYFKSPGLRLFFLVPEKWTSGTLPLRISIRGEARGGVDRAAPVQITRVMVGRIEIVTPEERALLGRIAAGPVQKNSQETVQPVTNRATDEQWQKLYAGYLQLGRFRNALLLDEQKRTSSPMLAEFIHYFRLEPYTPPRRRR
jgi:hypothetical protein